MTADAAALGRSVDNPDDAVWAFDGPPIGAAFQGVFAEGRIGDGADARPYTLRRLNETDLPALERFRADIFATLPNPDMYVPESPGFAAAHLGRAGVTLGVESDGALVACCVLGAPRGAMPNFGDGHAWLDGRRARVCHLASAMAAPGLRGAGLQRRMIEWRLLIAMGLGRDQALARVALSNGRSLRRLLDAGLRVRAVLRMHQDRVRLLLHRDLSVAAATLEATDWRAADDIGGMHALIGDGFVGVAARFAEDGALASVGFANPAG